MGTFRDLLIWQKAMALVTKVYTITKTFPKEELFGLTSQIRRSSISIPSNIAEDYGRGSNTELLRFSNIAVASLFELQTQIEIAYNIEYLSGQEFKVLYDDTRELEIMIISFSNKIKERK
ncbi:four helix bundle protein [Flavobacterium sp. DG1-102-2]|uniref:four helix bundle protein n=1 Tax=Flavobacterium sp. DG1-102-2 TaxID=3081663 RepID=UPI00294A41CE|nr:four helix bundle protein [Flavobacterium sp. DG1-102-2]MDV6168042.1 four helix bundle protein [Flavobacterium sp. DG1-102-2]